MSQFNAAQLPDEAAPEPFIEQIKDVLEHLHEFVYLQRHPLLKDGQFASDLAPESPAQQLRSSILAAIESLSPGPGIGFRSPHARVYNMLHLRYVEGLTVHEAAHDLNLSLRQAHRDLRRGEESVAAMLWWQRSRPALSAESGEVLPEIQAEMDRIEFHPRSVELQALASRVIQSITPLAAQQDVTFSLEGSAESVVCFTDPVIAQQVLISLASRAIQNARPGSFDLEVGLDGGQPVLAMRYAAAQDHDLLIQHDLVTHLAERLGWMIDQDCDESNRCTIRIQMSRQELRHALTLLVIDDNEGLKDLIARYLASYRCNIIAATSGEQGLQLAETSSPDVIILDVMMPDIDGWEVLQTLQHRTATQSIPVLICSVFNDPRLAMSLGAARLLPKPLRPEDLISALRELEVV